MPLRPLTSVRRVRLSVGWPLLVALILVPASVRAQTVRVKLATLVPDGSSWHLVLKKTAEDWKRLSAGKVTVSIFAGGVMGDDPDVVRKMRLGTVQAGVLTSVGVAEIDPSVSALGVPMLFTSYEEAYGVLEQLRPKLEANLAAKGFIVLNWADGGWVRFFAQKPVATPDDLRALKLFTWAGDNDALEIWKSAGFNPVPLQVPDVPTALQTGLVSALGAPPQVAILSQYYVHAKNMTDLRWQILFGATLIHTTTWERIPADLRPALLASARTAGESLRQQIHASETRDIEAMKRNGLKLIAVDAQARSRWQQLAESTYPQIRGKVVPADIFDETVRLRDALRKKGR
jgi:TRAP-type transport system periplasmic protein